MSAYTTRCGHPLHWLCAAMCHKRTDAPQQNDVHFVLNYLVITAGHPTIRGTGFMEYLGTDGYSGLIFAARITLPHLSVSSAIS